MFGTDDVIWSGLSVVWRARSDGCVQLDVKSQLVIIHLRWLQQTSHLHRSLTLLLLGCLGRLLTLFREQLGIVARELLQGDEEVAKYNLEPIKIRVGGEQSINEGRDLSTSLG